MSKLQDRVVVMTGASSGIGRATAMELARRGAKPRMQLKATASALRPRHTTPRT